MTVNIDSVVVLCLRIVNLLSGLLFMLDLSTKTILKHFLCRLSPYWYFGMSLSANSSNSLQCIEIALPGGFTPSGIPKREYSCS